MCLIFCERKCVTTASFVQKEMNAADVVSAFKHLSKGGRRNSHDDNSKKRDTPWGSTGEKQRGFSRRQKARRKAKASPKTSRRANKKTQPRTKARRRALAKERRTHARVEALEKGKKRRKMAARPRREIERSKSFDDPLI